jgi:hypothetical protein
MRAGHTSLKTSLNRFNIVSMAECECGDGLQTAGMCVAKSEIRWRWHYSVGMFFMEWTWPSSNTAWKLNVKGYKDLLTRYVLSRVEDYFGDDDCISMTMLLAIKQGL